VIGDAQGSRLSRRPRGRACVRQSDKLARDYYLLAREFPAHDVLDVSRGPRRHVGIEGGEPRGRRGTLRGTGPRAQVPSLPKTSALRYHDRALRYDAFGRACGRYVHSADQARDVQRHEAYFDPL